MRDAAGTTWTIGVDEAGYGPNLGPLVVAATAWRAESPEPLDALLDRVAVGSSADAGQPIVIADSKSVYQPGGSLGLLETAVHACVDEAQLWSDLLARLRQPGSGESQVPPWEEDCDIPLPVDADPSAIRATREAWARSLQRVGVRTPRLTARVVQPLEFNQLVAEHGTKGAALSFVSIGLARQLFDHLGDSDARVRFVFDKHGGRNRYGALLQEHFAESWIEAIEEGRAESRYRAGDRLSFRFRARGESEVAVGLASMTAKLLRELAMRAFNAYWRRHVPSVKPTAGYPNDAKRFRAEIRARQQALGVPDAVLWRDR